MKHSPNVNLSKLKLLVQERLLDKLDSPDLSTGTQGNIIGKEMDTSKDNVDYFPDDYLRRAKIKRLKLDKHKAWKKRRKERLNAERNERKASSVLSVPIPPVVTSIPSTKQQHESKDKETMLRPQKQYQKKVRQQQRIQQLTNVVEKLMRIRDLRRSKLEVKGHFFPETGDAFYNEVKSAVSSIPAEHDNNSNDDSDKQQDDHQKTIQPHVQDQWNDQPLDMNAYAYWLQGWENVDKLRRIRQQWDEYLVDDGTPSSVGLTSASKIPPTMVSPSPPSTPLWSRYLV